MKTIIREDLPPLPSDTVIPAEVFRQWLKAESVLATCQARSDTLHQEMDAAAEDARNAGYSDGYSQGLADGGAELLQVIARFQQGENQRWRELTDVVELCLRRILGHLPKQDVVRDILNQAKSQLAEEVQVTLHISPGAAADMQVFLSSLPKSGDAPEFILRPDPSLTDDQILLVTPTRILDASLSMQVNTLCAALKTGARAGQSPHSGGSPQNTAASASASVYAPATPQTQEGGEN